MKRYEFVQELDGSSIEEDDDGEWVKYEDIEKMPTLMNLYQLVDRFGNHFIIKAYRYTTIGALSERTAIFWIGDVAISEFNNFSSIVLVCGKVPIKEGANE